MIELRRVLGSYRPRRSSRSLLECEHAYVIDTLYAFIHAPCHC